MTVPAPPLLSICIPTYNRPREVAEALRILEDEIRSLSEMRQARVEVIVSDNASPGNPVPTIAGQYPRARLIQQPQNIGATRNFETCYQEAQGEYVLLLSDDDHLVAGSLAEIFSCLERDAPDVLYLPFTPQPNGSTSIAVHERNAFIRRFGFLPTLVSARILRHALIRPVLGRYLETNFHHFFYYLTAMETGERFCSIEHQVLYCPYDNNAGGYNWFATFAAELPRILREFPRRRVSGAALHAVAAHVLRSHIIPIFVRRKVHGYVYNRNFPNDTLWSICKIISLHFWDQSAFWTRFVPIAILPAPFLRGLRWLNARRKAGRSNAPVSAGPGVP